MDYSMKMELLLLAWSVIAYIIGFAITILYITTEYKRDEDSFKVRTTDRKANTRDAWIAFIWPLIGLYKLFCIVLYILNDIVHYTLLLIGIHYENTKLYKKLKELI